jgi:hypothetical protein
VTVEPVTGGGWSIAAGFAAQNTSKTSQNFYAIYEGANFNAPERGIIAAIARAHPAAPDAKLLGHAAQLAVHTLAEGYFGAPRTLSSRRAAGTSLTAVNRWLFGQPATAGLAPVSLTAIIFHNSHLGIAHIGLCQLFRLRAGILAPLVRDHGRALNTGGITPTRGIGLDLEISVDHTEENAEPGDRYLLLAGTESVPPDMLYARLAASPAATASGILAEIAGLAEDVSVMLLEVLELPGGQPSGISELAGLPLRPPPRDGDTLDGFKILRTIYRGRYTILKAAYDTIMTRDVALKIPLPAMLQDAVFTAGFMREAWIGTTVRGANLAQYLDLPPGRRSSLYLVLPLYRGETLELRLNRGPLVSLPEGIGIALQLCEAVQHLAAIQIVHRDIKPENIMLLNNNEVRLLDLGLAYLPGIDTADAVKPGGTIRYMAPELLQGVAANSRSEVYALAVTLYRMFSGGPFPFGQHEALPLARIRPDLPAWLGKCLAKAMAPKAADRYADAGEFAGALHMGLTLSPEDAPKPPPRFAISQLQLWRIATCVLAALCVFLLLRTVK